MTDTERAIDAAKRELAASDGVNVYCVKAVVLRKLLEMERVKLWPCEHIIKTRISKFWPWFYVISFNGTPFAVPQNWKFCPVCGARRYDAKEDSALTEKHGMKP